MEELHLYNIDDKYIEYLQQRETKERGFTKVSHNTDKNYQNKKPYVGIILTIADYHYFVPLTHPKPHYEVESKFFNRISTPIKLKNGRDYGRIMYCYMIPIKTEYIPKPIDFVKIEDKDYSGMLMTQYYFIKSNREKIINKASKLYNKVHNNQAHYLHKYCCAFELLEQFCNEYKK